jgi:hypothetical protein
MYFEETGFYLNHLTLTVNEPTIAREVNRHFGEQYTRIYIPLAFIIAGSAI